MKVKTLVSECGERGGQRGGQGEGELDQRVSIVWMKELKQRIVNFVDHFPITKVEEWWWGLEFSLFILFSGRTVGVRVCRSPPPPNIKRMCSAPSSDKRFRLYIDRPLLRLFCLTKLFLHDPGQCPPDDPHQGP